MPDPLPELLAAAKRTPTDDAPRRAVAEHLAANGDPDRGEFVRIQVANGDGNDWYPNRPAEAVTEGRLLKRHVRDWAGVPYAGPYWFPFAESPPGGAGVSPARGKFARGLCRVAGTPEAVRTALDRLPGGQADWLEMLDLSGVATAADLRQVLSHPVAGRATAFDVAAADNAPADTLDPLDLESVRELRLSGLDGEKLRRLAQFRNARPHAWTAEFDSNDPASAVALFASELLTEVRHAEVNLEDQPPEVLTAFARSPHFHHLTRLYLSGDEFPQTPLRALFASDVVRGLRSLCVSGYSGSLSGVLAAIVHGAAITDLRELELGFNSVTTEEADALARSNLLASLRVLDFGSGELTGEGVMTIVRSPNATHLERLVLSGTEIGEDAVFAMAQSPHLANLKELELCRCGVTAKSLRALAQSPHLSNLERLDLSLNPLPPFALDALSASRTLGNLKCLGLRQLVMSNDTFDRLLRSPVLENVEQLDLQGAMLSKAKLRALVEATALGRLRKLSLGDNVLMRGEIDVLGRAEWLPQVVDLTLYNNKMTDAGVRTLTSALTTGALGRLDLSRNLLTDESADVLLNWSGLSGLTDISLYQSGIADAPAERVRRAAWQG